jgi:hypothetical protein
MFTPLDNPDMAFPPELFGPLYDILLIIFDYFMARWPASDRLVCLLADGLGRRRATIRISESLMRV